MERAKNLTEFSRCLAENISKRKLTGFVITALLPTAERGEEITFYDVQISAENIFFEGKFFKNYLYQDRVQRDNGEDEGHNPEEVRQERLEQLLSLARDVHPMLFIESSSDSNTFYLRR